MSTTSTRIPVLPSDPERAGKADCGGNAGFLQTVFGDALGDVRPLVVSFDGHPGRMPASAWFGRPWPETATDAVAMPITLNNYFSLATFRPDDSGRYRRQKSCFQDLRAVMLDDIGTKVNRERITLPPSWLLETSPGNCQAGYLLDDPLRDGLLADRLMQAIVDAGLCDPGANGPRSRLARLPVGGNGKHTPVFDCRLIEWDPMRRYSVGELVDGLELDLREHRRPRRKSTPTPQVLPSEGDPVLIPGPTENAVLSAIRDRGLYKQPLGDGKHDVTCPWVHEHTDGVDGGTAYFEPDGRWPLGGFKCLHGHCASRRVRDLLEFLEVDTAAARMRPSIRVVAGEIDRVVDVAEQQLARTGRHFQRGGLIVVVVTDPGTGEARVQNVTLPALVRDLAGVASWERFDRRNHDWNRMDPPARHATVLLDGAAYAHLPVLSGLARQPYLRPDGTLMNAAGYDPSTGMFGLFNEIAYEVPPNPTREQARVALEELRDLLREFSFARDEDHAAALAAMLTAAARPSLRLAPMFHVRAHMAGSGKSYLCRLITAVATPQRGTPSSFPRDDEECRKLLLAELLRSPAVIEFDNLTGDLVAHKSLCTALTSEYTTDRILGVSKTASVSTRALFLSSGNNVGPVQDMTRRCITISLAPSCEIPAARTFERPGLADEVLAERPRYVSAALTIVRAWIRAGRPLAECKPLAGFGDWSDLCRQPLLWLGCADPTASLFESLAEDPDRETLGRLLHAWSANFGSAGAMVRKAVQCAAGNTETEQELREVLRDIADERGEINRRRVGWWLKRNAGRIVDGMRFARVAGNRSAELWRVESVSPVLSGSTRPIEKSVTHARESDDAYVRASRGH